MDTWLASFLVTGSISYLYYANRVFQLPLALFAIATSVALFPTIAKAIKNKDEQKALKYLQKAFFVLVALLGTATFIGIVFDSFIVPNIGDIDVGGALLIPGLRLQQSSEKAFQFGFAGFIGVHLSQDGAVVFIRPGRVEGYA